MATVKKVTLDDIEDTADAKVAEEVITDVKDVAAGDTAPVVEQAATAVTKAVAAFVEQHNETPVAEVTAAVTTGDADKIAKTVENVVEKPAITVAENVVEDELHIPTPARSYIDTYIDDQVETRIFAITNLVTHEFITVAGRYIVEIEAAIIAKVHETEIKAAIEAKFLKDTGTRLLNNALHYIELTSAKFLPHVKD